MKFGRQEDSHEFLRFLLDAMCKNSLYGLDKKMDPKLKETTVINQIFGGKFRSRITCGSCKALSDTEDSFMDISLDIRKSDNIIRALKQFSSSERLAGENQYFCGVCKKKTDAEKQVKICQAPIVLTLQLKRFAYKEYGYDQKIAKHIAFTEHLDLSSQITSESTVAKYSLSSVIVHSGQSCHSGHYYSYVKSPNGIWYMMDDCSVHPVGITSVLRQSAYILMYTLDISADDKEQKVQLSVPIKELQPVSLSQNCVSTKVPQNIERPSVKNILSNIAATVREKVILSFNSSVESVPEGVSLSKSSVESVVLPNLPVDSTQSSPTIKRKATWIEGSIDQLPKSPTASKESPFTPNKRRALDKSLDALDEEYDLGKVPKRKSTNNLTSKLSPQNIFQKKYEEESSLTKHARSDLKRSARHQTALDKYFK